MSYFTLRLLFLSLSLDLFLLPAAEIDHFCAAVGPSLFFFCLTTIRRKWIRAAEVELFSHLPNWDTERGVCRWLGDKNYPSQQYHSVLPVNQIINTVLRILSYQKNIYFSSDSPLGDSFLIATSNVSHVCNMCRKKRSLDNMFASCNKVLILMTILRTFMEDV